MSWNLYIPLSSERIATISSVSLDEIMPQGAAWGHQTACFWPAATRPLHRLDTFWNFKAIQGHLAAFYRTYISYKICEAGSCFRLAQVGASQVWFQVSGQSNRDPRVPWKQWLSSGCCDQRHVFRARTATNWKLGDGPFPKSHKKNMAGIDRLQFKPSWAQSMITMRIRKLWKHVQNTV